MRFSECPALPQTCAQCNVHPTREVGGSGPRAKKISFPKKGLSIQTFIFPQKKVFSGFRWGGGWVLQATPPPVTPSWPRKSLPPPQPRPQHGDNAVLHMFQGAQQYCVPGSTGAKPGEPPPVTPQGSAHGPSGCSRRQQDVRAAGAHRLFAALFPRRSECQAPLPCPGHIHPQQQPTVEQKLCQCAPLPFPVFMAHTPQRPPMPLPSGTAEDKSRTLPLCFGKVAQWRPRKPTTQRR